MRYLTIIWLLSLLLLTSCRMAEIPAPKPTQPLIIDGNYTDWGEPWYYFDQFQANLSVAADSQFLYLCLKTSDRQLMHQILGRGLVISFNAQGKKKPQISIAFPLGMQSRKAGEGEDFRTAPQDQPRETPRESYPRRWLDPESKQIDMRPIVASELEIREGKDKIGRRLNREQLQGLAVNIARQEQEIVYELRLPLQSRPEYSCALNCQPQKAIAVGIKVPEVDFSQMRAISHRPAGEMPGRMPSGGGGGRGAMGPEGPGGMPGGQGDPGRAATSAQEIWFKVRL